MNDHAPMKELLRPTIFTTATSPINDGDLVAAVDLGSNSFHMVVARYLLGQLRVIDRLRETVRLAEGLDADRGLDPGDPSLLPAPGSTTGRAAGCG